MIVVTGASGALGQRIVQALLTRVSPDRLAVSVREPAKASDLASAGVRVRRGDFDDRDSLLSAFEGATQLLMVSSNAAARGGDPLAQHRTAIEVAQAVGVRRIVYTSHMGAGAGSAFPPMRDHAATEIMLAECGLAWTALRNGFYAESALNLLGDVRATGVIEAPADGKVCWTAHDDLAEAAALVLTEAGRPDGPTPPLTGSAALDLNDLAVIAAGALGRPVVRETISDSTLTDRIAARGAPPAAAAVVLGLYQASRDGEFARTDPTLERMLGRPPIDMIRILADAFGG